MEFDEQENALSRGIKALPWRKWWFYVIIVIMLRFGYDTAVGLFPYHYDHIALGFQSEELMSEAFAKGYHNRQKLEEMESVEGGSQ
jgi:hypothetical protein